MTKQEQELLKQIQEDLSITEQKYGCTMSREQLLTEVLERSANPVRPEEAELFFSGVLPSGWKQSYFGKPKELSHFMEKLRKAISIRWCKEYVEPEIRALQRSESLRNYEVSIIQMKKKLKLPLRKDNMLSSHASVEYYLKKTRKRAGISPYFRFIQPKRFSKILTIYLEAMEEHGDCTQEALSRLLGVTQGTVSKLQSEKKNISTDTEYRVLLSLFILLIRTDLRTKQDIQDILFRRKYYLCLCLRSVKVGRLFAAVYLAVLLGFSVFERYYSGWQQPVTLAYLNQLLKEHGFSERFEPNTPGAFRVRQTKEIDRNAFPLWRLVRQPDFASPELFWQGDLKVLKRAMMSTSDHLSEWCAHRECLEVLDKIMQMDAEYLRLLYRMPEVFFSDLLPSISKLLPLSMFLEEMRQLRQPGLNCLMSKMEPITVGWDTRSFNSRETRMVCAYFKDFFQLMEYLSDNCFFPNTQMLIAGSHTQISVDWVMNRYKNQETVKPLTDVQKREYRDLFSNYIPMYWESHLAERIELKFSMNMQEWYFWVKMELLWYRIRSEDRWLKFMTQSMEEARKADLDEAGDATDA